ncbi:MAG: phenylacetate--CoA ligase family protein, partial [Deltaproteobacteria bacterium]|nr:phenylacetate--CoA ligase family protein [Deltaproteobacteria bacterium]
MTRFDSTQKIEFYSPAVIRRLQEERLKSHLEYVAAHSPYYQDLFRVQGVNIAAITLDSLSAIPCTDKTMLGELSDRFQAVPLSQIVDIVLSSGTTGKSTKVMYTENDLRRLAYNEEISFASCGLTADDVVLLTCTIDRCFIAGLAYFSGVRSLGASAIRNGLSSVESHLEIICR